MDSPRENARPKDATRSGDSYELLFWVVAVHLVEYRTGPQESQLLHRAFLASIYKPGLSSPGLDVGAISFRGGRDCVSRLRWPLDDLGRPKFAHTPGRRTRFSAPLQLIAAWQQERQELFYPYGKTYVQTLDELGAARITGMELRRLLQEFFMGIAGFEHVCVGARSASGTSARTR